MESHPTSFLYISPDSDFSFHNIPFGVFSPHEAPTLPRPGTRLGDWIIDLAALELFGLLASELLNGTQIFQGHTSLNTFMSLERKHWIEVRRLIQKLFAHNSPLKDDTEKLKDIVYKASEVKMHLPAKIGDYTDYYSSRSHAFNVGSIIRGPANALQENWLHIPIGYHGRASSIVVSGTDFPRPRGQTKAPDQPPALSECKRLDFEIQMGYFIGGKTNPQGHPIKVNNAWDNIFGFVLLNDWSFRDFQTWEYVPLGPFTAKNGITTISPWIVTLEALKGSEVQLSKQEPAPLQYLQETDHKSYDIVLTVEINDGNHSAEIVKTNLKHLYWSCAQQLTHHTISGCNMVPGDLMGTGTISGDEPGSFGSLLQITWGGKNSFKLGQKDRKFIEDGDSIVMRGYTQVHGQKVGFGECAGKVLPALPLSDYY